MCGGVDLFIREKGDVLTTAFGWLWIFWIVKCVCVCAWFFVWKWKYQMRFPCVVIFLEEGFGEWFSREDASFEVGFLIFQ